MHPITPARLRTATAAAAAVVALGALAGCGSAGHGSPSAVHTMPDGSTMSGSSMAGMSGMDMHDTAAGPSSNATMICSSEIANAVKRNYALTDAPVGRHSWANRVYHCDYPLPHGTLKLSVKDLDQPGPGRAYFDSLRKRLGGAHAISGMQSFGFPAFETPNGDVVFLKDSKTLWVDASGVAESDVPSGFTRTSTAYGVAAAVIACWSE